MAYLRLNCVIDEEQGTQGSAIYGWVVCKIFVNEVLVHIIDLKAGKILISIILPYNKQIN